MSASVKGLRPRDENIQQGRSYFELDIEEGLSNRHWYATAVPSPCRVYHERISSLQGSLGSFASLMGLGGCFWKYGAKFRTM